MFSDYGKELLKSGIIEAKAGNKEVARRYLERAVNTSNDHDVLAETWFWMSEVLDDKREQRKALENCLSYDLQHARARRSLALLDGKLRVDEIIDPDKLSSTKEGVHSANAERFMCPQCGGRMSFAPDGQSLVCEYCSRNQKLIAQPGTVEEKDFILAMATTRGHGKPLSEQVFHCEGCGSEFILPPDEISSTCVYCGSPHVVDWKSEEELLAPDGIIPHAFDQNRAARLLTEWVQSNQITLEQPVDMPRGIYLPLWTFDLGGMIDYIGETVEESDVQYRQMPKTVRVNDSYPVQANDIPVPASRKLSAVFSKLIPTFELRGIKPYDPRYLINYPAELYNIPMAEASIEARAQGFSRYKRDLPNLLSPINIISTSSSKMTVESFRLNLLPVWMSEIQFGGGEHLVLINGQRGTLASDSPEKKNESNRFMDWLGNLLED
jgi:hypothetical protein